MDGLEQLVTALLGGAPDGVLVSQRGTVRLGNGPAAALFGFAGPEQLTGVALGGLLDPEDARELQRRSEQMLKTGERFGPRTYRAVRQDGGKLKIEISTVLFKWHGEPAELAFVRDVSAVVRSQAQLASLDRLAAVGALAAGVAHEINNPMTAVLLGLQAIQRIADRDLAKLPNGAGVRADLSSLIADLESSSKVVVEVVKDLRRFARAGRDDRVPVVLAEVLLNAQRLVNHTLDTNVTLRHEHAPAPKVLASPARLEHVAVNLLLYAAQTIPAQKGGQVDVRTVVAADGRAGFEVSSSGQGISSADLPHIFEPFYVSQPATAGNGLGLAISHNIVVDLGGELQVDSPPGKGPTFRVLLPKA